MKKEYEMPCAFVMTPDREDILTASGLNLYQKDGVAAAGDGDVIAW